VRRVSVAGASGSGKSTLASALAARLGLPYVELDALNHGPNWVEATPEELRARVEAALAAAPDGWVCDGNYEGKLGDLVVERADTLVWLDLPLALVLARLVRRTATRIVRRTELWAGNRESLRSALSRDGILVWAVKAHRKKRRSLPATPERHPHLTFVRLRSPRQVAAFLDSASPSQ
jgi:adenylate kinase family enzyme